jgi:3,4-dihydroxy 2-butanone 4-phosphate synthase/GTP cyclohydrolase II
MDAIEDIVDDIRQGRMVVMVDNEDRENEGDLVMAAAKARSEDINFMARYGRGLICLTLTPERCRQLRLPLMVSGTGGKHNTNFTLSIEAAEGVTTGISAQDRARTVRAAVHPDAGPGDLVQPGHIFPIMAQPGGTLSRAGHTEAGCDLARMAGLEPSAVIVEVLNEDGTMARRPDLEKFAAEHNVRMGSIADLIRYRMSTEHTVRRAAEANVETRHGPFRLIAYEDEAEQAAHVALIHGDLNRETPALVRVHLRHTLGDVLDVEHPDFGWPLERALARVVREGSGVVVVLRRPEGPRQFIDQVRALDATQPRPQAEREPDEVLRTYGVGAQILKDLGVTRMRVLSAPKRMQALSGFGLEVVEWVHGD